MEKLPPSFYSKTSLVALSGFGTTIHQYKFNKLDDSVRVILKSFYDFMNFFTTNIDPNLCPKNETEDLSIKILKIILNEIIKRTGENIMQNYQFIMETEHINETILKNWIEFFITNNKADNQNKITYRNIYLKSKANSLLQKIS